ncbi:MAG: hypothetical protein KA775_12435, partial [Ottowia sp.]|nr:hypothetical protein [Ottowia sp.]
MDRIQTAGRRGRKGFAEVAKENQKTSFGYFFASSAWFLRPLRMDVRQFSQSHPKALFDVALDDGV